MRLEKWFEKEGHEVLLQYDEIECVTVHECGTDRGTQYVHETEIKKDIFDFWIFKNEVQVDIQRSPFLFKQFELWLND